MAVFKQTSFIGGALSPSLEGRTDYEKRLAGARRIHNFFVTPYGSLRRRPGIRYEADVYTNYFAGPQPSTTNRRTRLLVFREPDNTDTLIVLSHLYGVALRGGNARRIRSFTTPWEGRHLNPSPIGATSPGIKWSQTGNRILVTHPEYTPTYIVKNQDSSWSTVLGDATVEEVNSSEFLADYVLPGSGE